MPDAGSSSLVADILTNPASEAGRSTGAGPDLGRAAILQVGTGTRPRQTAPSEAIRHAAGGMAHDFNNLLGILMLNLELARKRAGGDGELAAIIDEALDAVCHGAGLTKRLLALACRRPSPQPVLTDANELVAGAFRLLRRLLGDGIDVELSLGDKTCPVLVDPAQLEAAIINLAANARDAMPDGGRFALAVANHRIAGNAAGAMTACGARRSSRIPPGDYVMIEAADTGSGMAAEVKARMFEPFFTTKQPGQGCGLGLGTVAGLLEQSGGHVSVDSVAGVGTTFRLYLPRAAAAAARTPSM
jgi:signal transduction histidine kinase